MHVASKSVFFLSRSENSGTDSRSGRSFEWQTVELLEEGSQTISLTADKSLDFSSVKPMTKIKVLLELKQYNGKVKCKVVSFDAV